MTYGFSMALCAEGNLSVDDFPACDDWLKSDVDSSVMNPDARSLVFSKSPKNRNFIATGVVDSWFVISIGSDSFGNTPAVLLQQKLRNVENPHAEEVRAAWQTIYGQYAAVAFNTNDGEYLAVSDPSGIRSLFSCRTDKALLIASSIPMLKRLRSKAELLPDVENQAFMLRYGYSLPSRSVLKDVFEIAPCSVVQGNCGQPDLVHHHAPATCHSVTADSSSRTASVNARELSDEHEQRLLEVLLNACSEQLGDAKKVGVLLGGFDSALVACLLVRLGVAVETYSFHYQESKYNQPYVDELAQSLGIKHHWVQITPEVIRKGLDEYGSNCNWPTLWLNYVVQTQHLCQQMASDGMQTCFSGDGCDTLFLGYPSTYRRGRIYQALPVIGAGTRRMMVSAFHTLRLESVLGHIGRVSLSMLSAATYPAEKRAVFSFQLFDDHLQKRLTNSVTKPGQVADDYFSRVLELTGDLSYERKLYLAKSYISPNRCKLVSSSDMSGLNIHSPYLHPSVMKFARSLPLESLRPKVEGGSCEGKYLLMQMAENSGLLPREVIHQPKLAAICSPIDRWLADDLRKFALGKLGSLPFDGNQSYLNSLLEEKWVEKLYKKYFSSDDVVSLAPSLLLTYASFFE